MSNKESVLNNTESVKNSLEKLNSINEFISTNPEKVGKELNNRKDDVPSVILKACEKK